MLLRSATLGEGKAWMVDDDKHDLRSLYKQAGRMRAAAASLHLFRKVNDCHLLGNGGGILNGAGQPVQSASRR